MSFLNRKRITKKKELEQLLTFLTYTIEKKEQELTDLEKQLQSRAIDKTSNLTMLTVEVLDIYQESGIKIPLDILEELSYMRLDTKSDIFKYIENQRHFWTLENRKKPFREVK